MTTNPNQSQQPDAAESYGGYTGYRPPNPVDDPYGAVDRVALKRVIQTMFMGNKRKGSSLAIVRHSSNSLAMSLLRVCSENRGKEVLDHPLPSPLQLVRVQSRKPIENLLCTAILVSALLVLLFSSLRGNVTLSISMLLSRLFYSCL